MVRRYRPVHTWPSLLPGQLGLGPLAVSPPERLYPTPKLVARVTWLSDGDALCYCESEPLTPTVARRWDSRLRKGDCLEVQWFEEGKLPAPPTWARRIDALPSTMFIETWRDTLPGI